MKFILKHLSTYFAPGTKDTKFKDPFTPGSSHSRTNKIIRAPNHPLCVHSKGQCCLRVSWWHSLCTCHDSFSWQPGLKYLSTHFIDNPHSICPHGFWQGLLVWQMKSLTILQGNWLPPSAGAWLKILFILYIHNIYLYTFINMCTYICINNFLWWVGIAFKIRQK